jgi:hypothetical protein
MSNKPLLITIVVAGIILILGGLYWVFAGSQPVANQNYSLISTNEAKVQELTPEQQQFIEQAGLGAQLEIPNNFGDTKLRIGTTENDQTVIVVNNNQVIPIYNVLSSVPISADEIVLTTGKYQTGQDFLTGDKKGYIYNLNTQTTKLFYDKNEDITDLFALEKDGLIVLSLGNRVETYNQSGELQKVIYQTDDKREQLVVADQANVPEGQFKIFQMGKGEQLMNLK